MEQRADDLAGFVVHFGMSPSDYYKLSLLEREAIITLANKQR